MLTTNLVLILALTVLVLGLAVTAFYLIRHSQPGGTIKVSEGYVQVDGGKVWYEVTGKGLKTPLVLLHGGPGAPGYYLEPMKALGEDRKLVFYHQLGCGKSDRISDTSLMTVDHYVEELRTVITSLGLTRYYLYGQSWGSMLGMEYYLRYPEGIKGLLFSSPCLSTSQWLADTQQLIETLPDAERKAIQTCEANKVYDDPAYLQAVQAFYERFVARKKPWSPEVESTFTQMGSNYEYMWGPSEFSATGELASYDRRDALSTINVPTLFIGGEFDEATPSTVKAYAASVQGAEVAIISGAAHLTMQDAPLENNQVIKDFLHKLDRND